MPTPCGIPTCNQPAQQQDPLCKLHDSLSRARAQATGNDPQARAHYWQVRRACVEAGLFVPEKHPWEVALPGIGEGLRGS